MKLLIPIIFLISCSSDPEPKFCYECTLYIYYYSPNSPKPITPSQTDIEEKCNITEKEMIQFRDQFKGHEVGKLVTDTYMECIKK